MWSESYEALSNNNKSEFRRLGNYLLSHTYLNRYSYDPSQQMTLPNRDYQHAAGLFTILKEYFDYIGWRLEKDDNYGFMSLINTYDNNRYRMEQFTTLFLYTCRLIYEEQREQANSFHVVYTSTADIIQKMSSLNILKSGKSTQKDRLEAQRTLAHFNIIEKAESTAWEADGNRIFILPSILAIISNSGINDIHAELADVSLEPERPEDEEI